MMTHIDPVCGVQVTQQNAAGRSAHQGKTFYFCSEDCEKQFDQDPEPYVQWEVRDRVVNTPNATGLRAGRLCATHLNPLGRP